MRYFLFIIVLMICSCTNGFEDANKNRKEIQYVNIDLLLATVQTRLMDHYLSYDVNTNISLVQAQYFSQTDYTDESNFNYRDALSSSYTEKYYLVLSNLDQMSEILDNEMLYTPKSETTAWRLIISVLRAFCYQNISDTIGPTPFFEAMDIENIKNPVYDSQQMIYTSLLSDVYKCSSALILPAFLNIDTQDLIYRGDMIKWQKFANSIMLRLAMRISDVSPEISVLFANRAVNENRGVFTDNDDNALLNYSFVEKSNLLFMNFDEWNIPIVASNTMYDLQTDIKDPRRDIYWSPSYWGDAGGGIYGEKSNFWKVSILNPKYLSYGKIASSLKYYSSFYDGPKSTAGVFIDYAEVEFFLAEASLKANYQTGGDVKSHFDKAVEASIHFHSRIVGIDKEKTNSEIEKYLNLHNINVYEDKLALIAREKWIALFLQGPEAWAELRRMDAPKLNIPKGKTLNDVPTRMVFSLRERIVNTLNVEKAEKLLSNKKDERTTHLWWDIK